MSQRAPLPPGTVLGEAYRVGRRIAVGGMGSVYEAEHLRLGRRCAVKVMASELTDSPESVARFHREIEITAKLAHPHIVQVFDVGQLPSGEPYLVMEYLEGEDLAQRLAREGRLTVATMLHVARQIAAALTATHARGIVHRDLKPANIFLLAPEGSPDFVKVVDYGISKMPRAASKLTRASTLVGTPEYMAPEQAKGKVDEIDHRTDQWAFGAMLWESLSGRPPFAGADVAALLHQIVNEPPAPFFAAPELEAVLKRSLAKKQADRYASIPEMMKALEAAAPAALATGTGARATEGPRRLLGITTPLRTRFAALDPALVLQGLEARPRRFGWWLVAALVLVPLAAGVAVWGFGLPGVAAPAAARVAPERASGAGKSDANGGARRRAKRSEVTAP
jgi:serine/threonine-protein kinase